MNIDKISKYLLCTYCVPGIGLSTKEYSSEQKKTQTPAFMALTF